MHLPEARASMNSVLNTSVPLPLIPVYLPVPWLIVYVPFRVAWPRQVLGLKCWMALVTLCASWKLPFCSTKVSTLGPGWDTPWSVNTPRAITTGGGGR